MIFSYATWNVENIKMAAIYVRENNATTLRDYMPLGSDNQIQFNESDCVERCLRSTVYSLCKSNQDIDQILVLRNIHCLLTIKLIKKYALALKALDKEIGDKWALASPSGLCVDDQRVITSYYSMMPCLPLFRRKAVLLDTQIDFYALNPKTIVNIIPNIPNNINNGFELTTINVGLLQQYVSVLLPALSCPVNGLPLDRDLVRVHQDLDKTSVLTVCDEVIPSLLGDLQLKNQKKNKHQLSCGLVENHRSAETPPALPPMPRESIATIASGVSRIFAEQVSVSIVVRTCFNRMELLKRLLASLHRASDPQVKLEILISTDVDKDYANSRMEMVFKEFSVLGARLVHNAKDTHCSRVRNLLGAIRESKMNYVWIIDDDDYVSPDSFTHVLDATREGKESLIFCDSAVMSEKWHHQDDKSILVSSEHMSTYPASNWNCLFKGINQIPICGFLCPRTYLQKQISKANFNFDLSEDYALILALFASTEIPAIREISKPLCHISVRGGRDNTVTMLDRRPWTIDIHGFLDDIVSNQALASEGFWNVLAGRATLDHQIDRIAQTSLKNTIERLIEQNRQLKKSNRLLLSDLNDVRTTYSMLVRNGCRQISEGDVITHMENTDSMPIMQNDEICCTTHKADNAPPVSAVNA